MKAKNDLSLLSDRVTKESTNLLGSPSGILDIDTKNNQAHFVYHNKFASALDSGPEDIWDDRLSLQPSKTLADC